MSETENKGTHEDKNTEETTSTIQVASMFLFVWIICGVIAFVWSIYCFGKTGTIFQKILGFLMAMFFGPLFFLLYKFSPTYCK
jgi:hypothetical protein